LDLRRVRAVALTLVPLAVGVVWMLGAMGAFGIKLNILNAAVLPSVLGLGIDGGVHVFHRAADGGFRGLAQTTRETGSAVAVCTATSLIGFGSMLIANHPGLRSIGALAVAGLGACLVAAVVVLPALLSLLRSRGLLTETEVTCELAAEQQEQLGQLAEPGQHEPSVSPLPRQRRLQESRR
jgi:hypothetical protein